MLRLLLVSLIAVVVGFVGSVRGDDIKRDSEKLQGTWQAIEGTANGKPLPEEQLNRVKVVLSGETMYIFPPDGDGKQALKHTFRLDPAKKPKAIDATRLNGAGTEKTGKWIYELKGDMLKLCLAARLEKDRPTEFAAPEDSGHVLLTLKRVKK